MRLGTVMFADAISTENCLALSSVIIVLIMMSYLLCVFITERKKSIVSLIASDIRKNLLGINQQFDKIYDALRRITEFAKGRSTFVIDTYGEDYNYIVPGDADSAMDEEDRKYFISKLLLYVSKIPRVMGNNVSVIGVINLRMQRRTVNRVKEFSVCLTMAIYCVYIDVNELNYFNNQYGHAAGDHMLVFVAETLSYKFCAGKLYRMGGDEFLIFVQNMTYEEICRKMSEAIEEMKYHISFGICSGEAGMSSEELVNEAEKSMYEEKAKYYPNKQACKIINLKNRKFKTGYTGIREIDAYMSVLSMRFFGVYCVTHSTDEAVQVLSPSCFSEILDETNSFTEPLKRYIHDIVRPEQHRQMLSFVEYETLEVLLRQASVQV